MGTVKAVNGVNYTAKEEAEMSDNRKRINKLTLTGWAIEWDKTTNKFKRAYGR